MESKKFQTGDVVEVSDMNRPSRNPCTVLHTTHTGRVAVRDNLGYKLRVDPGDVA